MYQKYTPIYKKQGLEFQAAGLPASGWLAGHAGVCFALENARHLPALIMD